MTRRTFTAAAGGTALIISGVLIAACSSPTAPANATVAHFTAHYRADGVDWWACSGTHTAKKGGGAKETETCRITADTTGHASMVGTYTGHPNAKLPLGPPRPWHSDYNHAKAVTYTITFRDAGHRDSSGHEAYLALVTASYAS